MSRLHTPAAIDAAPVAAQSALRAVEKQQGRVPNLFRVVANSPAALNGYLQLGAAATQGGLGAATLERIALAVAELNGCGYCLAAHSYLGEHLAQLDAAEIQANRQGGSNDPQADAIVRFAAAVVLGRGRGPATALNAVRQAGVSDAEVVDIVLAVALNTFTNYLNEVAGTDVDFPVVQPAAVLA